VSASDKGNETKRKAASVWQAQARNIATSHPEFDLDHAAPLAREILAVWPKSAIAKPSERTLRAYLSSWQNGPFGQK
jgi:hypothetical protein